jgi:hypothetical protein
MPFELIFQAVSRRHGISPTSISQTGFSDVKMGKPSPFHIAGLQPSKEHAMILTFKKLQGAAPRRRPNHDG